jgi:predicted RNase H-like HicB family nuclease
MSARGPGLWWQRQLVLAVVVQHDYSVIYQTVEDGWVMATVPELPGAVTQGQDMAEARGMIREAVELLLEAYRENAARDAPGHAVWETLTVEVPAA